MKNILFGVISLATATAALEAGDFGFNRGNSAHVTWDTDGLWTDASANPYGTGIYPGDQDTIWGLDYDSTQGTGIPNFYLNGDRTIKRLEATSSSNTRIIAGVKGAQNVENTLTITESFSMKAGAYYLFSATNGKLTIESPELVMGSSDYPTSFAYIQVGSSGQGNVALSFQQTALGGYSSNIVVSSGFDAVNGSLALGHVLFDMKPGVSSIPWPGEAGIDLGTSGATLQVASLRGGTAETRGTIKGAGTILIDPGLSAIQLTEPANFNRLIQGTLKVVKKGNSLQTFSYANTYSGGTQVKGGVLAVRNTTGSGLGTGDAVIGANGVLAGSGRIKLASGKTVTVESGGLVAPGRDNEILQAGGFESFTLQRLTFDGTQLKMNGGSGFGFRVNADGTSDQIVFENYVSNGLLLDDGPISVNISGQLSEDKTYILFKFSDAAGARASGLSGGLTAGEGFDGFVATFHYDEAGFGGVGTISMTVAAIPEPGSAVLFIPFFGGMVLLRNGYARKA